MNSRLIFIFLLGALGITSCFDPPEIPLEPSISLKSFTFKNIPDVDLQDSFIVELKFEDGDGDLGLSPLYATDSLPPFHEYDLVRLPNGDTVRYDKDNTDLPPFSCKDYLIGNNNKDTFYVKRNDFHYNFHLDFYRKVGGEFERFDFLEYNCTPGFRGRFFDLNTSQKERPLEGVLRYGSPSAFKILFRNDTLKFRAWIYDRNDPAGFIAEKEPHKSNVVESREFTLEEFLGPI